MDNQPLLFPQKKRSIGFSEHLCTQMPDPCLSAKTDKPQHNRHFHVLIKCYHSNNTSDAGMLVVIKQAFKHNNVLMNMNGSQWWKKTGCTLEDVGDNTTCYYFDRRPKLSVGWRKVDIHVEHQITWCLIPRAPLKTHRAVQFSCLVYPPGAGWRCVGFITLGFIKVSVCVSSSWSDVI